MSDNLSPAQIFEQAATEGKRRLDQRLMALLATGFIAGFTIIFGSAAQALIKSAAEPHFGPFAEVLGALGFGLGLVFLILGRAELFSENFFDPIATAFEQKEQNLFPRLLRLWIFTFVLNLVGGAILILVFAVEGTLHDGARQSVSDLAMRLGTSEPLATFARSVVGGALIALLSYLTIAAQTSGARITIAFAIGTLLALGPFEHVIVSMLHIVFGMLVGADLDLVHVLKIGAVSLGGNLVGGIGLVTLSHAAQAISEERE